MHGRRIFSTLKIVYYVALFHIIRNGGGFAATMAGPCERQRCLPNHFMNTSKQISEIQKSSGEPIARVLLFARIFLDEKHNFFFSFLVQLFWPSGPEMALLNNRKKMQIAMAASGKQEITS